MLRGADPETRLLRRNIVRLAVLAQALVFRAISIPVKRRFPELEHLVEAGFMTSAEFEAFEQLDLPDSKYWLPVLWALRLITRARDQDKIATDVIMWNLAEVS